MNWLIDLIRNKLLRGDDYAEKAIMRVIGAVDSDDPDRKRLETAFPRLMNRKGL